MNRESNGLYGNAVDEAFKEWRGALQGMEEKKPIYGPDYKQIYKNMKADARVAQKVFEWRKFQHRVNGADEAQADQMAQNDMNQFRQTFGD